MQKAAGETEAVAKKKLGPLPLWAVGGAGLVFLLLLSRHKASGGAGRGAAGSYRTGGYTDSRGGGGGGIVGNQPDPPAPPTSPVPIVARPPSSPSLTPAKAPPVSYTVQAPAGPNTPQLTGAERAPVTNDPNGSVVVSRGSGSYATPGGSVAAGQTAASTIAGASNLPITIYGRTPSA